MNYLGIIGSVIFAISGIPQALMCIKNRTANGVSGLTVLSWFVACVCCSIYAMSIGAYPLLLNYCPSAICSLIIGWYKYNDSQRCDS